MGGGSKGHNGMRRWIRTERGVGLGGGGGGGCIKTVSKCGRTFCTASEIGRSPHLVAVTWKYKNPCYFTIW